ncbi:hypothetical protein BH09PAT3_BH09PAT3_2070 [soil metagenome]
MTSLIREQAIPREPGDILRLYTPEQMVSFEDAVAHEIDPHMSELEMHTWEGRIALHHALQAEGFDSFGAVELHALDRPYQQLLQSPQNGWRFSEGTRAPVKQETAHLAKTIGYLVTAERYENGEPAGLVQSGLWYVPSLLSQNINRARSKAIRKSDQLTVRRFLTRSKQID